MPMLLRMEYFEEGSHETEEVGCCLILNNKTGTDKRKNYDVTLFNGRRKWKATTVEGINPKKQIGWDILAIALHNLLADRNSLPK